MGGLPQLPMCQTHTINMTFYPPPTSLHLLHSIQAGVVKTLLRRGLHHPIPLRL